jgi:hypothetical protein
MSRDHIFVRCEECRNHGRCKRDITLRLDAKYESRDTLVIQRYGRKLADAIEGTADKDNHDGKKSQ